LLYFISCDKIKTMGNDKKFYYKKKKKQHNKDVQVNIEPVNYTQEQLDLTLDDLKLSESTKELLKSNRIEKAIDLVKKTDKDMYKVQGLNKKILFEVKDRLKDVGLSLRQEQPVTPKEEKPQQKPQQNKKPDNKQKQEKPLEVEVKSKFGLSDKVENKQQSKQQEKQVVKVIDELPQDGLRKVMKGGKWGYVEGSKVIIPTMYDEIFAFKDDLASVELNEKCGFVDRLNNIVIPLDYDMAMSFSEGLALVSKGNKCGYINKNNEVIIPFEYDAGTPFEDGEAKVKKDQKWATITKDGTLTWI